MKINAKHFLRVIAKNGAMRVLICGAVIVASSINPSTVIADTASKSVSVITGVEDLTGKTLEELKTNAVTAGTWPTDDMDKIFFIYNVKTGRFINAGGYWGTHVSLQETPISLWANVSTSSNVFDFSQNLVSGQGCLMRWSVSYSSVSSDHGVYIDRNTSTGYYGWKLEAVSGDSQNTYKLYTYKVSNPNNNSAKLYLCANGEEKDQDIDCEAFSASEINSKGISGYDTWRIFSMKQIYELQKQNTENMTKSIDLSFMLKCQGFSRTVNDVNKWNTSIWSKGTGSFRFGLEKYYSTTPQASKNVNLLSDKSKYTFNGKTYSTPHNYQMDLGKYFCADAKNVRGVIYQDVQLKYGGSYVVECKGYSNTKDARLFAVLLDKNKNVVKNTVHETILNQISQMSETEQENLHVSEQNIDYAGKNFYASRKYLNTVLVHVPEELEGNSEYYVRFGIIIGDDSSDTTVDDNNEWTVFDDFRLLYASKTTDEDLILDEDRADMKYLSECSNTYKNKILHLNKSFTLNKWNSFVLPVDLTVDQLRNAFGANVRLARLDALTSSEIQFKTVDLDNIESSEVGLEAYTPYIIYPTREIAPKQSPAYRALLTETGNSAAKTVQVIIKANNLEIPNVNLPVGEDNHTDLSNMNLDNWTTKKMYSVEGNGTMTACGTFVRTFGPNETVQDTDADSDTYGVFKFGSDKGTIISGCDDLKGSYFFYNGNVYCSNTRVRGLRGFSCWFKPNASESTSKTLMYLDDIAQDATSDISSLVAYDKEETAGKAAQGVFSINGQRISDDTDLTKLPAGIYIVNGKKYIVK